MKDHNGNLRDSLPNIRKPVKLAAKDSLKAIKENINCSLPPAPKEPKSETCLLVPAETKKIKKFYLDEILTYEMKKVGLSYRPEFLKAHKVSAEIRARMVA